MAATITNNIRSALKSRAREFNFRLTINDTLYTLDRTDMYDFETTHEAVDILAGNATSKQLKITLDTKKINPALFITDMKLKLEAGIYTGTDFSYIDVGVFYIYSTELKDSKLTITAYDYVYRMAGMEYPSNAPRGTVSVSSIITYINNMTGNTTSYSFTDFNITIAQDEKLFIRDVLRIISSLTGYIFFVKNNGTFAFIWRVGNSTFNLDANNYYELKFQQELFKLRTLKVKNLTQSWTLDNSAANPGGLDLEVENDYVETLAMAQRIYNGLRTRTLETVEVRTPGYPQIELGDYYMINDTNAEEHTVEVFYHNLKMSGGGLVSIFGCKQDTKASNSLKKTYYDIKQSMDKFSTQIQSAAKEIALRAKQEDLDATNTAMSELSLKVDSFTVDFTGTSNNLCPDSNLRCFQDNQILGQYWGWWATEGKMLAGSEYWQTINGFKYRGWVPEVNGQNGNLYVDITDLKGDTEYRIEFDYFLEANTYGTMGEVHLLYFSDNAQVGGDGSWKVDKNKQYRPSKVIRTPAGTVRMRIHWLHPGTNGGSGTHLFFGRIMVSEGKNAFAWQPKTDELSAATFSMQPNGQFKIATGQGDVILSAEGIPNCYSTSVVDNCDTDKPANLTFFIDREINRVDRCKLFLSSEWFRAYSRAASDGGSTTQTSTSSGAHDHIIGYVGSNPNTGGVPRSVQLAGDGMLFTNVGPESSGKSIRTAETVQNHSHSVTFPNHAHGIDYGLYEENPNAEIHWVVTIDDTDLPGYYSDGAEIDVSTRITTSGRHTVRCTPRKAGGDYIRARCTIALDIKLLMNGR